MYPNIVGEPIKLELLPKTEAVVDAIYNPLCSNLVIRAKNAGLKATGGLYMLVAQAAFAAELFVGQEVKKERIYDVYKKIVSKKRNIVLTGMPSSGKSTVGKQLAQTLNMRFIDTDNEIERVSGKKISEIFENLGEDAFRDIESKVVEDVSAKQNCVIATGGGAILRDRNIMLLKGNGTVYFIDRPLEKLITTDDRPLSSNRDDLVKRYNERYNIYCKTADKKLQNDGELQTVIDSIKEDFLK